MGACPLEQGFEVEFATSAGERRRGALRDVWSEPFQRTRPVRSFPKFHEQRNFTGLHHSATTDAHVGFESWLERDVAMALDFDPQVVGRKERDHARSCRESCHSAFLSSAAPVSQRRLEDLATWPRMAKSLVDLHGQDLAGKIGPDRLPRHIVGKRP